MKGINIETKFLTCNWKNVSFYACVNLCECIRTCICTFILSSSIHQVLESNNPNSNRHTYYPDPGFPPPFSIKKTGFLREMVHSGVGQEKHKIIPLRARTAWSETSTELFFHFTDKRTDVPDRPRVRAYTKMPNSKLKKKGRELNNGNILWIIEN